MCFIFILLFCFHSELQDLERELLAIRQGGNSHNWTAENLSPGTYLLFRPKVILRGL